MDELIRWEGCGKFMHEKSCPDCIARGHKATTPEYRCLDCFLPDMVCQSCCVQRHRMHPFHTIEVRSHIQQLYLLVLTWCSRFGQKWTGSTFSRISLKSIGLVIHLNHASMRCPLPVKSDERLRVLHTNGIHEVAFFFCGCTREVPHHIQLLRRGLYPASQTDVRTCVTFPLLRFLHLISLTGKIPTHDMYRALEKLSINGNVRPPKPRYRPLMRVLTQWRHLKLLKRGGRGHDNAGVDGTKDGELVVQCPSCPHPGINLPEDWMRAPPELQFVVVISSNEMTLSSQHPFSRFLYIILICLDANFRLKNQLTSNYSTDPGLGIGWAYMLPRQEYDTYVLSQADEDDVSNLWSANLIVILILVH